MKKDDDVDSGKLDFYQQNSRTQEIDLYTDSI
jgi:hypothetical protein